MRQHCPIFEVFHPDFFDKISYFSRHFVVADMSQAFHGHFVDISNYDSTWIV